MTNEERDREFEVIWDGGEGLAASRETKAGEFWSPSKRLYNKKSDYWNKKKEPKLINPLEDDDYASG